MAYEDGEGIRSPLRYIGSKRRLAARITAVMDSHTCYVEPFGGSAAILLAKAQSPTEIYNDYDGRLVNFFRVCRDDGQRLVEYLRLLPFSREEFDRYRKMELEDITDPLHQAAAYFFMNRTSFASKQHGQNFGYGITASPSKSYASAIECIPQFAARLLSVTIEHRHWSEIIDVYDRPDTLFYCDPPYWGAEKIYKAEMSASEHVELAERLSRIQGKAMMSYYAGPEVEAMYGPSGLDWQLRTYHITKGIGKENASDKEGGTARYPVATEVLYSSRARTFSFESLWHDDVEIIEGDTSEDFPEDLLADFLPAGPVALSPEPLSPEALPLEELALQI